MAIILLASILVLFGIGSTIVDAEKVFQKGVSFDPEFGGLYAKQITFNERRVEGASEYQKFDVMLSTVHSRTFLVDKLCTDPAGQSDGFCATHQNRYDTEKTDSTRTGNVDEMKGGMKDMGKIVEDKIQLVLGDLVITTQKFGVMNGKMEEDPRFWGIRRHTEGDKKGAVEKGNKAEGCISLMPGEPEDKENFGTKTPFQTLIDSKDSLKDKLLQDILTIRMDKIDEIAEKSEVNGQLTIGALNIDEQCHSWSLVKGEKAEAWQLKIEALDGVDAAKGMWAVIDTTSEQITMPKQAWEQVNGMVKDGECDPTNLKPLKFQIGQFIYEVPAKHYLKKTKEGAKESCVRLLAQNSHDNDEKVHLGLPFLRSACVATDLKTKAVWLSGGTCKEGGTGGGGGSTGGGNGASSVFVSTFVCIFGFLAFAAPALMMN